MKSVLGIDPGLSGALALVAMDLGKVDVIDTPVHAINGKQEFLFNDALDYIRRHHGPDTKGPTP